MDSGGRAERRQRWQSWGHQGRRRSDLVELDADHPGFHDADYRARRNQIACIARDYRTGPVPRVAYTEDDHGVWRHIWSTLGPVLETRASKRFLRHLAALPLDRTSLPQLADLNEFLATKSGFEMQPVAGLVAARAFFSYLGRGVFLSTQYVRHAGQPNFTPEPDVIHEVIGHASYLADPAFSDLYRRIGQAADRSDDEVCKRLEQIYWHALEFGVVEEDGALRGIGAALNSSVAELSTFDTEKELLPWDIERIAETPYDPSVHQTRVFVAPSWERLESDIRNYCQAL